MTKRSHKRSHDTDTSDQAPVVPIETLRQQRIDAVAELKALKSADPRDPDAILAQKFVVQDIDAQIAAQTDDATE